MIKNFFIEILFKYTQKVIFEELDKKEVYLFKIKLFDFLLTMISMMRKIKRKMRLLFLLIFLLYSQLIIIIILYFILINLIFYISIIFEVKIKMPCS